MIEDANSISELRIGNNVDALSAKVMNFLLKKHGHSHSFQRPTSSKYTSKTTPIEAEGQVGKGGRTVIVALDLKYPGKLKTNQAPPQVLYHDDSVKQLVQNDSLRYEKSKQVLMNEFKDLQISSHYFMKNKRRPTK